jgi:hypothetical protein
MTKAQAKKQLRTYGEMALQFLVETAEEAMRHEHGGWDEVDDHDGIAMVKLGLEGTAKVVRDLMIKKLRTPEGLALVVKAVQANFDYAEGNVGDFEE